MRALSGLLLVALAGCQSGPPRAPPPPPPPKVDCVVTSTSDLKTGQQAGLKTLMKCVQNNGVEAVEPLTTREWVDTFNGHEKGLQVLTFLLAPRIETFDEDLKAFIGGGVGVKTVIGASKNPGAAKDATVIGRGIVVKNSADELTLLELVPTPDARKVTEGNIKIIAKKTKAVPVRMGDEIAFILSGEDVTEEGGLMGTLSSQVVFKRSNAK